MPNKKGAFITLEGCEGSGKSTQLKKLGEYLTENGYTVATTREPGGVPIAEKIRSIILEVGGEMSAETEALLFAAARVQHIDGKISPETKRGVTVLCDRYIDSSFAYQAYARGLGYEFVSKVNSYALGNMMPDVTLFYDISPAEAFARKGGADVNDRMESSGLEFHEKVYEGYKELLKKFPERIVRIDARKTPEEVFSETLLRLKERGII